MNTGGTAVNQNFMIECLKGLPMQGYDSSRGTDFGEVRLGGWNVIGFEANLCS